MTEKKKRRYEKIVYEEKSYELQLTVIKAWLKLCPSVQSSEKAYF